MEIGQRVRVPDTNEVGYIVKIEGDRVAEIQTPDGRVIRVIDKVIEAWPLIKQLVRLVLSWFGR